jgi:hypothetical protein
MEALENPTARKSHRYLFFSALQNAYSSLKSKAPFIHKPAGFLLKNSSFLGRFQAPKTGVRTPEFAIFA